MVWWREDTLKYMKDGYKNYRCILTLSLTFDYMTSCCSNFSLMVPQNIPSNLNFYIYQQECGSGSWWLVKMWLFERFTCVFHIILQLICSTFVFTSWLFCWGQRKGFSKTHMIYAWEMKTLFLMMIIVILIILI